MKGRLLLQTYLQTKNSAIECVSKGVDLKRFQSFFNLLLLVAIVLTTIMPTASLMAQSASATWSLSSDVSSSVTGSTTAIGATYPINAVADSVGFLSSKVKYTGKGEYGDDNSKGWIRSKHNDIYIEFKCKPATGKNFNITSVAFKLSSSNTNLVADVAYSTDGSTFTNINNTLPLKTKSSTTLLQYTSGATTKDGSTTMGVLDAINVTVNDGNSFILRVYPWDNVSTGSTVIKGKYVYLGNIVISGTTSDAPVSTIEAPTTQASNLSFATVTSNSMIVNWANGDGANRTVFVKEDGGAITNPVDGTTYSANIDWSAKGTQLGTSGYYCVYNGTGNSVALTNLNLSKSYTVQVFEFNGTDATTKYLTTTATGNPKTQAATLPVSLTSFKASTQIAGINLNWATSSENNADKFVVERRTATTAFVSINEIKAKGKANNYIVADKNVANGETYYYRLKMVDKDATFIYSNLSSATFALNVGKIVSVYPNPATNNITVSFPEAGNSASSLSITDAKGALVLTAVIAANSTQKTLDVSALKTGIYIININTNEGRKTLKLVKN